MATPTRIPNIGPRERRSRLRIGVASALVAAVLLGSLFVLGVPRWWRLPVAFPLWIGALGILQSRGKT